MIDPLERIIRPIVEGQIRGFLKEHPGIVDAVDWYKPRADKSVTFINSLAKRIVRDLVCPIVRARLAAAILEPATESQPKSTVACSNCGDGGPPGIAAGRADAALVESVGIRCDGFDRPECEQCWLIDDIQETTYDSAAEIFTAKFCKLCRARLLTGEPQGWAA